MRGKHVKYREGQWFAIPIGASGYAMGIIVRGSYTTKGGLGYFFGPLRQEVPDDAATWTVEPKDAVLISWFGDLHIIRGRWPLIASTRPFRRQDWPVPRFGDRDLLNPSRGWITEYDQESTGLEGQIGRVYVPIEQIVGLPQEGLSGATAVEMRLARLLGRHRLNG